MRLLRSIACIVAGILAFSAGTRVEAQPGGIGQINNPTFSPYLNLLRTGSPTYLNYYGLVRPELDLRNAAANLQGQVYQNDQYLNSLSNAPNARVPLTTGHAATFLNTQGHFLTNRPGSILGRGGSVGTTSGNYGSSGAGGYGGSSSYGSGNYGAGNLGAGAANMRPTAPNAPGGASGYQPH